MAPFNHLRPTQRITVLPCITLLLPPQVGCVAWPRVEEPPLGAVRCVRRDLLRPAATQPAPLWAAASTDNKFWRVSVWPLTDSPAATFAALKGDAKPAPHQTLAPMY